MQTVDIPISELKAYDKNAKIHDAKQNEQIANSLLRFGWKQPLVVDRNNVLIVGHGRLEGAKIASLTDSRFLTAPCIIADDLTDEEIKAYRLADNKLNESPWDFDLLSDELSDITVLDMSEFGFDVSAFDDGSDFFNREERNDKTREAGNAEYNEFLEKFEAKKTTDDCYTPDRVYNAVADWVAKEYGVDKDNFVRPFYPGGDYQKFKYKKNSIVVDNPPFSIFAEIMRWYADNGILFFLFGPTLTLFSSSSSSNSCTIPVGATVTYENGAKVNTSFATNLEDETLRTRTAPELYEIVTQADEETQKQFKKELPKYSYPDNIITAAMVARWSKYGIDFKLSKAESEPIDALDEQKEQGKSIFGRGYLLSERAAAERAAAERAAAERWELSDREKDIVARLSKR
jgi:hypothetical protein